jgi:hypothetical protein
MGHEKVKVFISYARENAEVARRLYRDLKSQSVEPWLDTECILPGQRWSDAIAEAIKDSDYFFALFSKKLAEKRGYVQSELKKALEVLRDVPPGKGYLMPIRLDDCRIEIKEFLEYQWVDLFPIYEEGFAKILKAILPQTAYHIDDDFRMSQAGWGVIFATSADPRVYDALEPLLQLRKEQFSGERSGLYKEFVGPAGYREGETHLEFLSRKGVGPSFQDPSRVPNYLLIVGDPGEIPFEFQYGLGVQYYVGRIHFDNLEGYKHYANTVVGLEKHRTQERPNVLFFGPQHFGDQATKLTTRYLLQPLRETLSKRYPGLKVRIAEGEDATKKTLLSFLTKSESPQLLFLAGHGMMTASGHEKQQAIQGSVLCADWPGFGTVEESYYLSSSDLASVELGGMVLFLFNEFGGGTPDVDEFRTSLSVETLPPLAPRPFLSSLAKHLMGKCGAGAILAHVDRIWATSILWDAAIPQIEAFEQAVRTMIDGKPVGVAHHFFASRYAELASHLSAARAKLNDRKNVMLELETLDARNFILIGDPAFRITEPSQADG